MGTICTSKNKNNENNVVAVKSSPLKKTKTKAKYQPEDNEKENVNENEKEVNLEMDQTTTSTNANTKKTTTNQSPNQKNNVVSIDSNVFVVRGECSPDQFYIREKTLGKGSYGTVYLVKHKHLHRYFAMKVIRKTKKNKSDEESLVNEINILKKWIILIY